MVVVLLYWTDLPYGVKTCPRCFRANSLPKSLEELYLLLLTEHRLASGQTLKLKDDFRLGVPELLLDLCGHPIKAGGHPVLVSTREPDARALLYLHLYDNRPVGHLHCRHAPDDILFVFHVAGCFEDERKRDGVTHPVAIIGEGMLWQILLKYLYGGFAVDLVDDVSFRARHYALASYRHQAVAYSPTRLCFT